MEYVDIKPRPLENIALSFSGGGFRAASYTLGCLSYMEAVEIGDRKLTSLVNFISSASGGTITNLTYTTSQRKGISFADFYKQMTEQTLQGRLLVDRVFNILQDQTCWVGRPLKSRNLINAFSIAYDELVFKQETFGIYWKHTPGAVAEVCANSTEFDNGMLFRFQNAGVVGNKFLQFKNESSSLKVLQSIKLGDILECSSCFPVGFEPFMFPVDFTSLEVGKEQLEKAIDQDTRYSSDKEDHANSSSPRFGFMDGGIDDNQGIDSFIRAEERLEYHNGFGYDLYISCDVSSNYTGGFEFPQENKTAFLQKPSLLQYILLLLVVFGFSFAGVLSKVSPGFFYALLGVTGCLLGLVILLSARGFIAWKNLNKKKNTFGILIFHHIFLFLKLRLSIVLQLLNARATSAAYLSAVVFLKKIRRISYDRLFEKVTEKKLNENNEMEDDDTRVTRVEVKHWREFSLQNAIYLLSPKNNEQRIMDLKHEPWFRNHPTVSVNGQSISLVKLLRPSEQLQGVAKLATEMDTTLWFDENHIRDRRPEALIATGQFTTCYNLLRYAFRFSPEDPYWSAFQTRLVNDWHKFNQAPYWQCEQYAKA
jgi:hypothetical protein